MNATLNAAAADAEETMELLGARVRQRGDLPGFSKVVSAIIGAMRGDDDREFNMTRTVLQDPALTHKVLRLANSAMYSVFGQGINTVSKAVIVLGTEAIGHLALGLKLVDGLAAVSAESANARAEMEAAVLAGHIARQVASSAGARDAEEAVVCSMLHSLGRMMITFYLADRWQALQNYSTETAADENQAARAVLGIGLDEIGRRVARQWGLPAVLVDTLQDMPPTPVGEPLDHQAWLATVSTLSTRCAQILSAHKPGTEQQLSKLAAGYADMLGLDAVQVLAAVDAAQATAAEEDAVVVRPVRRDDWGRKPALMMGKPADAAAVLAQGVSDIRDALENVNTGQLMSMALETVYQGLRFTRTIAFLRNHERSRYTATLCLGGDAQELIPKLSFPDAYQPDVFHAALANDKMIFVENAQDPAFVNKVPRWWKDALPNVRSFMVMPLTVNRHPVGFIYGDWDMAVPPSRIEQAEIRPLNELRMLVMRALEQRRPDEPSWARTLR